MELGHLTADAIDTTIDALLAAPGEYAGRVVRIEAWVSLMDEDVAIYPDRETALLAWSSDTFGQASRRSAWLDLRDFPTRGADVWKVLRVHGMGAWGPGVVEGVVDSNEHGHLGLWRVGLLPVTRLVLESLTHL